MILQPAASWPWPEDGELEEDDPLNEWIPYPGRIDVKFEGRWFGKGIDGAANIDASVTHSDLVGIEYHPTKPVLKWKPGKIEGAPAGQIPPPWTSSIRQLCRVWFREHVRPRFVTESELTEVEFNQLVPSPVILYVAATKKGSGGETLQNPRISFFAHTP